ncbi:MAG: nucleotide sugar dehydrogenase, partial [Saprospiraceae bacterium]|nr:nucleotide sugar dehydrogenase [Saprospiraceae bacterium]
MYQELANKKKKIAVVGLGYVGLPLALEFAKHFQVIGFDISQERVEKMRNGFDPSNELPGSAFEGVDIQFSSEPDILKDAHFYIVAVPTPVDEHKVPNLEPIYQASKTIGKYLKKGDYVIYESTV